MNCPRCATPMQTHVLDGHLGREVEVDVCEACQSVWFDMRENLQLTPGATLGMFRLIGERVRRASPQDRDLAKCPRCQAQLRRTQDMQRATRFEYFRCPNDHGRLITFFDFLKEKDFVKPLTPAQIIELRSNVDTINCSNCGAPIDLAKGSECGHCGSALSMLDLQHAERLVTQLKNADRTDKPVDPALPLALARARREADHAFRGLPGHEAWDDDSWSLGLVGAGLSELFRLIKRDS
jgi:Zn-finger nucleic acid-binding protein